MNPIAFNIKDRAFNNFFNFFSAGDDALGWMVIIAIILIIASCFFRLYKKDKSVDKKKANQSQNQNSTSASSSDSSNPSVSSSNDNSNIENR